MYYIVLSKFTTMVSQCYVLQTTRLATLIDDGSENHQEEVLMTADPKAFWPHQTGLEMFDIATVCLRHKPKLRPPIEQVTYSTASLC